MAHSSHSHARSRRFIAFVLFLCIAAGSISLLGLTHIFSGRQLSGYFTSYQFVSGYRQDILDYASDRFMKNGIPTDSLESIITYDCAETISSGYYLYQFQSKRGYSQQTELKELEQLGINLRGELEAQLKAAGQKADKAKLQGICDNICA